MVKKAKVMVLAILIALAAIGAPLGIAHADDGGGSITPCSC